MDINVDFNKVEGIVREMDGMLKDETKADKLLKVVKKYGCTKLSMMMRSKYEGELNSCENKLLSCILTVFDVDHSTDFIWSIFNAHDIEAVLERLFKEVESRKKLGYELINYIGLRPFVRVYCYFKYPIFKEFFISLMKRVENEITLNAKDYSDVFKDWFDELCKFKFDDFSCLSCTTFKSSAYFDTLFDTGCFTLSCHEQFQLDLIGLLRKQLKSKKVVEEFTLDAIKSFEQYFFYGSDSENKAMGMLVFFRDIDIDIDRCVSNLSKFLVKHIDELYGVDVEKFMTMTESAKFLYYWSRK